MHFSPNRNDKVPNDGTMLLTLNGLVIKRVKKTKFLGCHNWWKPEMGYAIV